jgi:O-antigen ligase
VRVTRSPVASGPAEVGATGGGTIFMVAATALLLLAFAGVGRDLFTNPAVSPQESGAIAQALNGLRMLIALLLLAGGFSLFQKRGRFVPSLDLIAPYTAWASVTLLWTLGQQDFPIEFPLQIVFVAAVAVAASQLGPAVHLRILLWLLGTIIIASTAVAVILPVIGVHSTTDLISASNAGSWRGIMSSKNIIGALAAYAVVLFCAFGRTFVPLRGLLWFLRVGSTVCLVASFSVTAWISAAVGLVAAVLLFSNRQLTGQSLARRVALLLIMLACLMLLSPQIIAVTGRDLTLSGRTEIWEVTWLHIMEQPFIGHGEGSSPSTLSPILQRTLFEAAIDPHNGYLDRMFESGLLGVVLLVGGAILAIRRALINEMARLKDCEANRALALCIIVAFVQAVGEVAAFRVYGSGFVFYYALSSICSQSRTGIRRHVQTIGAPRGPDSSASRPGRLKNGEKNPRRVHQHDRARP